MRHPLPQTCKSGPCCCLILATFSAISPFKNTDGCHSPDVMVFEATYLVAVLTPGHASACCGQYGSQISKVLRPNNRSNGRFICFLRSVPRISSEYELIHPPYAKPPLVSSSGPPGAWMTPSREICSSTITFLMVILLIQDYWLLYANDCIPTGRSLAARQVLSAPIRERFARAPQ